VQLSFETAPEAVENEPAWHNLQSDEFVIPQPDWYSPAEQGLSIPRKQKFPGVHREQFTKYFTPKPVL
jgi:hypothetical protein